MSNDLKNHALPGILDRDLSIVSSKALVDKYSPYMKELINYATHFLVRCERSAKNKGGTPLTLIALYYHVIQMTDAIEVLISNCCFCAAMPLLRSQLEALLSIEYILEDDYETRSAAWLVEQYLDIKRYCESMDVTSASGAEFQQMLKADKFMTPQAFIPPLADHVKLAIAQIDQKLNKPKFAVIAASFTGKNRIKRWYQIRSGPKTIKEMASRLRRPIEYEILYRDYSAIVHAQNSRRISEKIDGTEVFTPIRAVDDYSETVCISAGTALINATLSMGSKFRPEENVRKQITEIVKRHRPEALLPAQ